MNKTIEQIVEEVFAWAAETFPNTSIEDLLRKLSEEEKELHDAASTYLGPSAIARAFGISKQSLYNALRRAGIPTSRKPPPGTAERS